MSIRDTALQAKAAIYHHHGRNMIDWIMDTSAGEAAVWQSVNHTKINAYGVEAHAALDFRELIPTQKVLTSAQLSYSYIAQDKEKEPGIVSQYALEYLRHKLTGRVGLHVWRKLHAGLNIRWQDRVGIYTDFQGQVHDYRPFALLDARLTWNSNRYSLYAEANNMLDNRHYVDFGNVPQPGLWLVIGGRWHFDL